MDPAGLRCPHLLQQMTGCAGRSVLWLRPGTGSSGPGARPMSRTRCRLPTSTRQVCTRLVGSCRTREAPARSNTSMRCSHAVLEQGRVSGATYSSSSSPRRSRRWLPALRPRAWRSCPPGRPSYMRLIAHLSPRLSCRLPAHPYLKLTLRDIGLLALRKSEARPTFPPTRFSLAAGQEPQRTSPRPMVGRPPCLERSPDGCSGDRKAS